MQCFELSLIIAGALCLISSFWGMRPLSWVVFNSQLTEKNHPISACSMAEPNRRMPETFQCPWGQEVGSGSSKQHSDHCLYLVQGMSPHSLNIF